MDKLNLTPNFGPTSGDGADTFYAELITAQAGLSDDEAVDWLAGLTPIRRNHIADRDMLREAFALARESKNDCACSQTP